MQIQTATWNTEVFLCQKQCHKVKKKKEQKPKSNRTKKKANRQKKTPSHLLTGKTHKSCGRAARKADLPSNWGFPNSNNTQLTWFATAAVKPEV